ncbi:biosynthetic arginine decarboxylase [Reinekea marinisedimentorum]|uniref:Biosynthetic arginine decarboxylase n=1 Tax=Reinekea marinisedimentorum TaxID=230495 RepID=A0A4R3HSE2_9GAMM|nr:biosynthetic arginine decarboxylase [Reinekea marinisedimentorum]TCS35922.1 arginine decarboxylase [Reinekea marinisedimentorum]
MKWNVSDTIELYNVNRWSEGYFSVNKDGDTVVTAGNGIPLKNIVLEAKKKGMQLPLLVRFPHILHDRVAQITTAFANAIKTERYKNHYQPLYPIKVNQQRRVVEEIINGQRLANAPRIGLEAGSKPELMAVMAEASKGPTTIVCNGYKDEEYIRLALSAEKLGHHVYLVVEKSTEVDWILSISKEMNVLPRIGVRARLSSTGRGKWQSSGGEKSKFGLTASEIISVIDQLKEHDRLSCFQLLHFHLGSQIANIRDIQIALRECARFYVELRQLNAPVEVIDVGGGLGVDYEGTRSRESCSMNYSTQEYANNVVYAFREACETSEQPHPIIFSESGRAVTAHHAVLLADVSEEETPDITTPTAPADDAPNVLKELWYCYQCTLIHDRPYAELYHDASYFLNDVHQAYTQGYLSLSQRAQAEEMARAINYLIANQLNPTKRAHRDMLDDLNEKMASKLFVNFSVFQSLPDVWGIDQIFPIMPLTGLDREPTVRGIVQDITCDSDGKIKHYVDGEGVESTLPLPNWQANERPWLGFFMVGAYQEILGDLHNLFGDTNSLDAIFDESGELMLVNARKGDSIRQVLSYVDFSQEMMVSAYQRQLEESSMPLSEKQSLLENYRDGMKHVTYLQPRQTAEE